MNGIRDLRMSALGRLRHFWVVPVVFWSVVVGLSFNYTWRGLERQILELSSAQGRHIFHMVESVRLWNAEHGGVFVIQSEKTQPNPYLDVPDRDPVTVSGKRLTLVNPAYMTRQLSASIFGQTGIRVHLTSLKPINPDNRADPWETDTLRSFERGVRERIELFDNRQREARFMAPLVTQEACLACHRKQGYKVGDIRGGISVSFSVQPIEASIAPYRRDLIVGHLVALLLLSSFSVYLLARLRGYTAALEREVAARTGELHHEVQERRQAETQLRLMASASSNGLFGMDAHGRCTFCNPTAATLLDDKVSALVGSDLPARFAADNPELAAYLQRCLQGETVHEENLLFHATGDNAFPIELRLDPILAEGAPSGAVASFSDISERQKRQLEVWRQANFDHLTGLPNRQLFEERFARALGRAKREGHRLAVLFIDLDGFKPVNDTWGHAAGDAVLVEVARRLLDNVRESDIAARLGGDEFVVVLTEAVDRSGVVIAARNLLQALAVPYALPEGRADVSASIGVAFYPEDGLAAEALLTVADQAMYRAKAAGRRACHFSDGTVERPGAAAGAG